MMRKASLGFTFLVFGAVSGCLEPADSLSEFTGTISSVDGSVEEGVRLNLGGDIPMLKQGRSIATTTDDSGTYSYNYLPQASYTITPVSETHQFLPKSIAVLAVGEDLSGENFLMYEFALWIRDADGDGFGDMQGQYLDQADQPEGYVARPDDPGIMNVDCNDNDDNIYPYAAEIEDFIDQNCDGITENRWFLDSDADGYGDASLENSEIADFPSPGYVAISEPSHPKDCDDENNARYPNNSEISMDGIDQNCDELDRMDWYQDSDGDGHADTVRYIEGVDVKVAPVQNNETTFTGYISISPTLVDVYDDDCNDSNNAIHPEAEENPNDGIDQNCDGFDQMAWYTDSDGDGFGLRLDSDGNEVEPVLNNATSYPGYVNLTVHDCDDADDTINPVAQEIPGDGVDQDCDELDSVQYYRDLDGDGYGRSGTGANDDDIENDEPIISESLTPPDGYVDINGDCNDTLSLGAAIHFGAEEIPSDGIDQNCDGFDLLAMYRDADNDGYGLVEDPNGHIIEPLLGTYLNNGWVELTENDCDDVNADIHPGAYDDAGDDIDDDCDGIASITWYIDKDLDGYGSPDVITNENDEIISPRDSDIPLDGYVANGRDCDDDNNEFNPEATEVIDDGVDRNCNGLFLNTLYRDLDGDGDGDVSESIIVEGFEQNYVKEHTDCDDTDATIHNCSDG